MEMGTLIFDIDGTLTLTPHNDYPNACPDYNVISKVNEKYNEGYEIVLWTARGTKTGIDWRELTERQLKEWGVKYHSLYFGKPDAIQYIDDKGVNVFNWCPDIYYTAAIDKIWGKEYLLTKNEHYAFKRLEIDPGKNISHQYHKHKHETWHIAEGHGIGFFDGKPEAVSLYPGYTIDIPPGRLHQAFASIDSKLVIIEASTTELEDIVRLEE